MDDVTHDSLFDAVRDGKMTPEQAEAAARSSAQASLLYISLSSELNVAKCVRPSAPLIGLR